MNKLELNQPTLAKTDVTSKLYAETNRNEVFNTICYVLANRERARKTLTVPALKVYLSKQGADFKTQDYINFITFLSSIGIGTLKLDKSREPVALIDIQYTLQSIGQAATGKITKLKDFMKNPPVKADPKEQNKIKVSDKKYKIFLSVLINGNPVILNDTAEINPEELGTFLFEFNNLVLKQGK